MLRVVEQANSKQLYQGIHRVLEGQVAFVVLILSDIGLFPALL